MWTTLQIDYAWPANANVFYHTNTYELLHYSISSFIEYKNKLKSGLNSSYNCLISILSKALKYSIVLLLATNKPSLFNFLSLISLDVAVFSILSLASCIGISVVKLVFNKKYLTSCSNVSILPMNLWKLLLQNAHLK